MYDAMLAETVTIAGDNGDEIEAYSARTLQPGPVGGVVVIHHLPGYDRQTKEFARAFAAGGPQRRDAEPLPPRGPRSGARRRDGGGQGLGRDPRPG